MIILEEDDSIPSIDSKKNQLKVGKAAHDLLLKKDLKQGIVDTQREVDKTYFEECQKCINSKPHCEWKEPWFLVVIYKKERLLENVIRRYFFGRQTLPTPDYDQTVWRFYPTSGNLEYCWTIPDKNTCMWIYSNLNNIPSEHEHLAKFVVDFIDSNLYSVFLKKFNL